MYSDGNNLLVEILKPLRYYLSCAAIPVGIYALLRLVNYLIPGSHKLPRLSVRDRTVLITGASAGLGKALATKFYREGAKLILVARSIDSLKKLCNSLKALPNVQNPNEPVYAYVDITNVTEDTVKQILSLSPSGIIDVLVNNAGISVRGSCANISMEVHRKVMETNYFGPLRLTTALLNNMSSDGAIVVINSVQGKIAVPYRSAYSASKHACQAFFDSLRCEKGPSFQILSVFPGYMRTLGRHALNSDGKSVEVDAQYQPNALDPSLVADRIYDALRKRQSELILTSFVHRLGLLLRLICPNLMFYVMYRRSLKEAASKKTE